MGMKTPLRKIMGKRKRLARVWASKTSFTATDIKPPIAEKAIDDRIREGIKRSRSKFGNEKAKRDASSTAEETMKPKNAPPIIFPISTALDKL